MPAQVLQLTTLIADAALLFTVGYFFLRFRHEEDDLKKKEQKKDSDYHRIVDDALTRERKILDDAAGEANTIITGAKYVQDTANEEIKQALVKMSADIQRQTAQTADKFVASYMATLEKVSQKSIYDYQSLNKELGAELLNIAKQLEISMQNISKRMDAELQKGVTEFHSRLLPNLEKELEDYKKIRMAKADESTKQVVQGVAKEVLNKLITQDDQQTLLIDAMEKAKKGSFFD